MEWLIYLATGSVAGFAAGLFGIGGGLIIVPALVLVFVASGFSEAQAITQALATSLATISITSISSAATHWRSGNVNFASAKQLAPGLVIGASLGAWLVTAAPGTLLLSLFALFACTIALRMWFARTAQAGERSGGLWLWGTGIGIASAIFGIGGGSLSVPLLSRYGHQIKRAVGTSAVCGLPIAWASTLTFIALTVHQGESFDHYIHWPAWFGLVIISPVFAILGAKLVNRISKLILQRVFASFLLLVGLRMLWSAFA